MTGLYEIQAHLGGMTLLVALAAFGFFIGILTGLFGVGGAFLVTPLLNILFGIPYALAIGSGLSFTIGSSSSGLGRHMRLGNFEPRSILILAATSMLGAVLGATLNGSLNLSLGEHNYTLMMHGLFIVVLLVTAKTIVRPSARDTGGRSILQRLPIGPYLDMPTAGLTHVSVPGLCLAGLAIGVMKGMLGIGGGVLLMPLLILLVGLRAHQAVGTSLGVVMFSSIAGTVKYGLDGKVNLWIVMALLFGSTLGVQIGAQLCNRLHGMRLRRYFAVLVLLTAALIAADLGWKLMAG